MSLVRQAPAAAALLGAVVAALAWYSLASATGLIFHFMPAAPPLVAAWLVRELGGGSIERRRALIVWAGSLTVAAAATTAVAAAGLPLDSRALTAGVLGLGAVGGGWIQRRSATRT